MSTTKFSDVLKEAIEKHQSEDVTMTLKQREVLAGMISRYTDARRNLILDQHAHDRCSSNVSFGTNSSNIRIDENIIWHNKDINKNYHLLISRSKPVVVSSNLCAKRDDLINGNIMRRFSIEMINNGGCITELRGSI